MGEEKLPGHVAHSPSARGSSGDDSWGCRTIPVWSALGTGVAVGDHPGENLARGTWHTRRLPEVRTRWVRGALGGFREGFGTRDRWRFRKAPGGWSGSLPVRVSVWAPGRVALSHGIRGKMVSASALGTGGELGRHPVGFSRLGVFGDMWHSPKEGPKGLSGRLPGHVACSEGVSEGGNFEGLSKGGFRAGFRDTWRTPKDGPEGGFNGGFEGAFGRASGTLSYSERAPKGSSGLVGSKGFPEGGSFGGVFIVGLGINT